MFSIRVISSIRIGIYLQNHCTKFYSTDSVAGFHHAAGKLPRKESSLINELQAISKTPNWRKAADFIRSNEFHCTRASLPVFNIVTTKAFLDADESLGWELIHKISTQFFQPNCDVFLAYWNFCSNERERFVENVEKMLAFMGKFDVIPSQEVVEELSKLVQKMGGSSEPTNIDDHKGVCDRCQQQIQELRQSLLEFHTFKREFEELLLKKKVSTVELGVFRQMVNKRKTFDYVIDALNVTRIFPDSKGNIYMQGKLLARLVDQLRRQNRKVFIVGKKHVDLWPEQSINFVRRNATVYLSHSNIPVDDILMMYATLISGPKSHFVTNDMLDEYLAEFSDSGKQMFRNWQKQHQHLVSYNVQKDLINIQRPPQFVCNVTKLFNSDAQWHVPFTEKPLLMSLRGFIRVPINWICIDLKTHTI